METIIKKAIEGGWLSKEYAHYKTRLVNPSEQIKVFVHNWQNVWYAEFMGMQWPCSEVVCDPLFWQALGKACEWEEGIPEKYKQHGRQTWLIHAAHFHELNLTEGWDKAVEYLAEVTK